jgi:hypothetical protein
MRIKLLSTLATWIIMWTFVAVDQATIAIKHILNNEYISAVTVPGKTVIERDGMKFLVNTENVDYSNEPNYCGSDEFWEAVEVEVSEDKNNFVVRFPNKISIKNTSIRSVYLQAIPLTYNYETHSNAFHMHGISQAKLDLTKVENTIELNLVQGLSTNYASLIDSWNVFIVANASDKQECYKSNSVRINHLNYNNFSDLNAFYVEDIIDPVFDKNFDIATLGEEQYLNLFFQKRKLKSIFDSLPQPNEAALALLNRTVHFDLSEEFKYATSLLQFRERLSGEVVIGLFGDVQKEDLETINNIINTLNIVIPDLKIKYSKNNADVNLPIHFSECNDLISNTVNQCKDSFVGVYYPSSGYNQLSSKQNGWIWVDSSSNGEFRQHVLVHEFGHALGLGHNLCYQSVMSYDEWAPTVPYFNYLDLIQLRLLYDSRIEEGANNYKALVNLELDEEKFSHYEDSLNFCEPTEGFWNNIIEFQQGKISEDELYNKK